MYLFTLKSDYTLNENIKCCYLIEKYTDISPVAITQKNNKTRLFPVINPSIQFE